MRIFLIRHGESLGNIDLRAYEELQDANVPLTIWGAKQAEEAGSVLNDYCGKNLEGRKLKVIYSPYLRTKQTKDILLSQLTPGSVAATTEEYLLREQDMGIARIYSHHEKRELLPETINPPGNPPDSLFYQYRNEFLRYKNKCDNGGIFYATPPLGESLAAVTQRVHLFLNDLLQNSEKGENILIVGHKAINRGIQMILMKKEAEWFAASAKSGNCEILLFEGDKIKGFNELFVHKENKRPPLLPKDYMVTAFTVQQLKVPLEHATQETGETGRAQLENWADRICPGKESDLPPAPPSDELPPKSGNGGRE